MPRTIFRIVSALALLVVLAWVAPRVSGQASPTGASGFPSTKNGEWPNYNADVKGSSTCPSIRSTPPTSTSSRSRGASRPTTSVRVST